MRVLARDLAIDLGTANTLVYARGQGIVLNEPSVIALNSQTGDVLAMGHDAWQMIGRTPSYIVAVRPLRQGAITDFDTPQRTIRLPRQPASRRRQARGNIGPAWLMAPRPLHATGRHYSPQQRRQATERPAAPV